MEISNLTDIAVIISFAFLLSAFIISFIVMIVSKQVVTKIVVLELFTSLIIGFAVIFSKVTAETIYLNVALVVALVGFMGTIAYGSYIRRKND
ncbi:MAG: monovalent cation/H+ antiporter complex subunit F [Bacteroidales bacterium]